MRRLAPRPLSQALERVIGPVRPATALAHAQAVWAEVAGPGLAARAAPTAERDGVLTISCESAVWAQELDLLGGDLLVRLGERLEAAGVARPERLRFVIGSPPNRS